MPIYGGLFGTIAFEEFPATAPSRVRLTECTVFSVYDAAARLRYAFPAEVVRGLGMLA